MVEEAHTSAVTLLVVADSGPDKLEIASIATKIEDGQVPLRLLDGVIQLMLILADTHVGVAMTDVADHVLDCKGMACPLPIVKTAKAIKEIDVGQVLELLATDPGVEPDMAAWTRRTKHQLMKIDKVDDVFHVFVQRTR